MCPDLDLPLLIDHFLCFQTLNKEAVEAANAEKVIPDIRPGDVIQLRVVSSSPIQFKL